MLQTIETYFLTLQNKLCFVLNSEDGAGHFCEDRWCYHQGGGGVSRMMTRGNVFESGAVHFSHIFGNRLPELLADKYPKINTFHALGISVILHPQNPYVPIVHMNLRFFCLDDQIWWFGGGLDLTPCYGFIEDCRHWHHTIKVVCDQFDHEIYQIYKKRCDHYFYLKHRKEQRGIGGIFFDKLNHWPIERCFSFIQAIGDNFPLAYLPIVQKRKILPFTQRQRDFQCYRRGRYVEFNLLYDQGTLFGLQSGGRVESILSSLPPLVSWHYHYAIEPGSPEEALTHEFLVIRDWEL